MSVVASIALVHYGLTHRFLLRLILVTMAQPLANGYPIGAILLRDAIGNTMTFLLLGMPILA